MSFARLYLGGGFYFADHFDNPHALARHDWLAS